MCGTVGACTQIGAWTLGAGTVVVPNVGSALKDPALFAEPQAFRPERFLQDGGQPALSHGGGRRVREDGLGRVGGKGGRLHAVWRGEASLRGGGAGPGGALHHLRHPHAGLQVPPPSHPLLLEWSASAWGLLRVRPGGGSQKASEVTSLGIFRKPMESKFHLARRA